MPTDVTVTINPDRQRYEAVVDEATLAGFVDYQETSDLLVLTHTEVGPAFEDRGMGGVLACAALDDVRERRSKALVTCPSSSVGCVTALSAGTSPSTRPHPESVTRSRHG